MKTLIYSVIFVVSFFILSGESFSQKNDNNLAIRYIKLGNSYRQAGEFDIAEQFLAKAKTLLAGNNTFFGKYWTAAADEYFAYTYCDKGEKAKATSALLSAIETYDKIIKQPDGSQEAAKKMLKQIEENGCPCVISTKDIPDVEDEVESEENNSDDEPAPLKGIDLPKISSAKSRDYCNFNLSDVPADLPSNIENLGLCSNKFSSFPVSLSRYKNLKFLDLSNNNLKEISSNIADMKSLTTLLLNKNQISKISDNICSLKNLKVLDLRGNPIQFPEIKKLIQCMPNTLIYHDKFERIEDEDE